MINRILRKIFYLPIRLTAACNPVPFEPLKHINLDPNLPICYLTVSSSVANLLTIERLTQRLGLPSPFAPLYLGGQRIKRLGYLRRPSFFSARARNTNINAVFQSWFDAAARSGEPLQILPVTVLWSRNPSYEGLSLRGINFPTPSWKKFLVCAFAGGDNCTIVSDPIDTRAVQARLATCKHPEVLRRFVELHFLKKARSVTGKPFPNRAQLIDELTRRPAVRTAISQEAARTGAPAGEVARQARAVFDTMVADTRYRLLSALNKMITCLWKRIYHGQTIMGAPQVRALVQNGCEIIYIPCHRSHMDYVLLSFVIFHEGLPIPQIASGDNLNFFPVGPFIRRMGSYFIRRTMKGDNFYITLFNEYLSVLFERGYATEFFIEGGRSRTGRMLPPKTGMVAMTVQAQLRGLKRPIAFVPTYLGYEHVTEVGSYMRELEGEHKRKENIWQLLGIFKRLRYYGRGYVTFGTPIIVTRYLNERVPDWRQDIDPTGMSRPAWLHDLVHGLAQDLIVNLNASATVNGINLCAMALISDRDHTMSMRQLNSCVSMYLTLLKVDPQRRRSVPQATANTLIQQALELKKFRVYYVGDDMRFVRPSRGQTLQLTYFKNNIVHLFALPALLANIIIRNGHLPRPEVRSHARALFYFLRHELFSPVTEPELDPLIEAYLDSFIRYGYITQTEDMIFLSGDSFEEFNILARSIYLNLIRYLVAATALKHTADGTLSLAAFVTRCLTYARRLPTEVTDNSPEFADPILFKIMCATLQRHQYFTLQPDETLLINQAKVGKLTRAAEPLLGARDVKILNGKSEYELSPDEISLH